MATKINMLNPDTGLIKTGFYGFSWTTFFFGAFPALFRSDFITFVGVFVVLTIIAIATEGFGIFLAMIVWAFMYNKYYTRKLIERGFKFNGTVEENARAAKALGVSLSL
jgi:hypothetical protein